MFQSSGSRVATVFLSYCHTDEALRNQLENHLSILERNGLIKTWHDRRISAGQDFARAIDAHIQTDDIILLLVSPDFLDSDYCHDIEMTRALERHEDGEAIVIPVILRDCIWKEAPFGKLMATPTDGRPVTQWPDMDEAFRIFAQTVKDAASRVGGTKPAKRLRAKQSEAYTSERPIRSSNLRVAREFTDRDKDGV